MIDLDINSTYDSFQALEEVVTKYCNENNFKCAKTCNYYDESKTEIETGTKNLKIPRAGRFYCSGKRKLCPWKIRFKWDTKAKNYVIYFLNLRHDHTITVEDYEKSHVMTDTNLKRSLTKYATDWLTPRHKHILLSDVYRDLLRKSESNPKVWANVYLRMLDIKREVETVNADSIGETPKKRKISEILPDNVLDKIKMMKP